MRSLDELQKLALNAGINSEGLTRVEIMDRLRGVADRFQIDPMKATDLKKQIHWGEDHPFRDIAHHLTPEVALEPKYDGCRMRFFIGEDGSRMNTGRRSTVTYGYLDRSDNFPHLAALKSKKHHGTVLDGEIMSPTAIIPTKKGGSTKSKLNAAVAIVTVKDTDWAIKVQDEVGPFEFYAFDVLVWRGEDVRHLTYIERRRLLRKVMKSMQTPYFQPTPVLRASPQAILWCLQKGYEGAMIKTKSGPYESGKRSKHWHKVKTMSTMDAVITGWDPGEGRNEGKVGGVKVSLAPEGWDDFAFCADSNLRFTEVGQFGAMDDALRQAMTDDWDSFQYQVVEVMAQGKTKNGRLRHPQLVRFRPDKYPADCGMDQLDHFPEV